MFETLMELPLFRGVSRERIADTVGSHKFHFLKYMPEQLIFRAGDPCSDLAFVLSGKVKIVVANPDGRFCVEQTLKAPEALAPEFLFGRHTQYPCSVTSIDTVSMLRISKPDYLNILTSDPVFLLNYVNQLAMSAQKSVEGIIAVSTGDIAERIAFWISALTQPRTSDIVLRCTQRDLVSLFGVPRTSLKQALESMKAQNLVDYTPYSITVRDRRALLALLHNHAESADD